MCARAPGPHSTHAVSLRPACLLPPAHAAQGSGSTAPHAWLCPHCRSLHVPTPPWRCPEVSRCWWSCFCCPSVLMDTSPRSRRSRSCLLLRTVRPCTATHPLLTAGLDSPSAHAHALAALGACRCHAQLRARGCHARSVQARAHGEARGSPRVTLLCCGCHHPPAAPAHVLILGSSLLSPRHSPVLILGSLLALCWRTRGSR